MGESGIPQMWFVHALLGLVTAWLLTRLRRYYPGVIYLRQWVKAWYALAMFSVGSAIAASLEHWAPGWPSLPHLLRAASLAAGYAACAYAIFGCYEYARRQRVNPLLEQGLPLLLASVGIFMEYLALEVGPSWRADYFLQTGVRGAVTWAACLVCVWQLAGPRAEQEHLGRSILLGSTLLLAAVHLYYFASSLLMAVATVAAPTAYALGVDLVVQAGLATGVVIALLEDERRESRRLAYQAERLAYLDPLTELANRKLLSDRLTVSLSASRRTGYRVAVLVLDLDGFATVNDSFGYDTGDALLQQVAKRCRAAVRDCDTIARLGGDEFVLLLTTLWYDTDAYLVARKLLKELAEPFDVEGTRIHMTATAGISVFPDDGEEADKLLAAADLALREGKRAGKNTVARAGKPMMSAQVVGV